MRGAAILPEVACRRKAKDENDDDRYADSSCISSKTIENEKDEDKESV